MGGGEEEARQLHRGPHTNVGPGGGGSLPTGTRSRWAARCRMALPCDNPNPRPGGGALRRSQKAPKKREMALEAVGHAAALGGRCIPLFNTAGAGAQTRKEVVSSETSAAPGSGLGGWQWCRATRFLLFQTPESALAKPPPRMGAGVGGGLALPWLSAVKPWWNGWTIGRIPPCGGLDRRKLAGDT